MIDLSLQFVADHQRTEANQRKLIRENQKLKNENDRLRLANDRLQAEVQLWRRRHTDLIEESAGPGAEAIRAEIEDCRRQLEECRKQLGPGA